MWSRVVGAVKQVLPGAHKTMLWVVKLTCIVSALIFLLRYFGALPVIAAYLEPVMRLIGLPGEAALAYVSGYFVNIYSCIAVADTLSLSSRSMTILAVLVMCSHNMIVETAVQKKTGSSALRIVLVRTISGLVLAFVLNKIMPAESESLGSLSLEPDGTFWEMFLPWLISLAKLCVKMALIIYSLSIVQQLLKEFGVMDFLARLLKWPLKIFGLPQDTSFLWIIANTLGLAYGAAVIMQERETGGISNRHAQLLNTHISISHSNLEDLFLFWSVGGIWWIILLTRWIGSLILVWEERLEFYIKDRRSKRPYSLRA
ncbi:MAG: nucleoside recognition domain-containing protein [Bacteroidales bacterium]|nr:nucleoside recognition domain-containing protein [Bacteroidales bacterium]